MGQGTRRAGRPAERGSSARRALSLTRRAWTCYWTQRAVHATAGVLHALDDRALKDIGLHRSEIEAAARGMCPAGCACTC